MEAPELYNIGEYINGTAAELFPKKRNAAVSDQKLAGRDGQFAVDDLLDFPNDEDYHDGEAMDEGLFDNITTTGDRCNSLSVSPGGNFNAANYQCLSGELSVPYDNLAELEWLSHFVEYSFSTDQNLRTNFQFLSGPKPSTVSESSSSGTYPEPIIRDVPNNIMFQSETPLPGKARSKRSGLSRAIGPHAFHARATMYNPENMNLNTNTTFETRVRRCTHCRSEKTPQWRTGPMGPKTLCNAIQVRSVGARISTCSEPYVCTHQALKFT